MKTIIAGSRGCSEMKDLIRAIQLCGWSPSIIVSGGARGVDRLGEQWAKEHNIPIEQYLPDWKKYGKSAGFARNITMAENAEALIALWDGKSNGTRHMIDVAEKKGLKVFVYII